MDETANQNGDFLNLNRVARDKPKRSGRTWLIGCSLAPANAPHQTIDKAIGLAVFAGDALSSVAYASPERLPVLAAAGTVIFHYMFPIVLAMTLLLAILSKGVTVQPISMDSDQIETLSHKWSLWGKESPIESFLSGALNKVLFLRLSAQLIHV